MGLTRFLAASELIADMLKTGGQFAYQVIDGLPEDARILSAQLIYSSVYGAPSIDVLVESETFGDLQPGAILPTRVITLKKLNAEHAERGD